MDSLIINGGKALSGVVKISGSKNAALPIMACTLLSEQKITIHNVPKLTDVVTMRSLLQSHGSVIETIDGYDQLTLVIECRNINNLTAPYNIVRKMRASIWVLGPLLTRFGYADVSLPGGCAIGARQVDIHLHILELMGARIEISHGYIKAKSYGRLKGVHFYFNKISVGATINAIMAATLAKGETVLSNCAKEPEVVDLCKCLTLMGAEIQGIGTNTVKIIGKDYLRGASYNIMPDRIEAGTYMIAAAITKGDIKISGVDQKIIDNLMLKLYDIGMEISVYKDEIKVKYVGELRSISIQTEVYPGFPTDLQAQFMSLMTLCNGISSVTENIFENRFMHVPELCRMGANISINGNKALITGVEHLSSAEVMASDLRASVSLILAGLAAKGITKINRVYHLDRGYQLLEEKLVKCGAEIHRISSSAAREN